MGRATQYGWECKEGWDPVTGVLPPLTDEAWQAEFARYRATSEYRYEAGPADMTLFTSGSESDGIPAMPIFSGSDELFEGW